MVGERAPAGDNVSRAGLADAACLPMRNVIFSGVGAPAAVSPDGASRNRRSPNRCAPTSAGDAGAVLARSDFGARDSSSAGGLPSA